MITTYDAGRYQAEIISHGFDEAGTGMPYLFFQVRILSRCGPQGKPQTCPSFVRTIQVYLASNATCDRILLENLLVLGVDLRDLARLDLDSDNAISLVGMRVDLSCDHEVYLGKTRERWRLAKERKRLSPERLSQIVGRLAGEGTTSDTESRLTPAPPSGDV